MKALIRDLVHKALQQLVTAGALDAEAATDPTVERTRDPAHGDFATNAALLNSKAAKMKPRELAERIVAALPASEAIAGVEIAGPGFINFRLTDSAYQTQLPEILQQGPAFGRSTLGAGKKIQVEFVSANPTGPLHVGHGRGAAYGAAVADLLEAVGYRRAPRILRQRRRPADGHPRHLASGCATWSCAARTSPSRQRLPGRLRAATSPPPCTVSMATPTAARPTQVFDGLPADDSPDGRAAATRKNTSTR